MSAPWLHVVGIGEDGLAGLAQPALNALREAEVVIGGDRHHELGGSLKAERLRWPSPFDAMVSEITSLRDRRPVVLVTGDPLWFSVGARLSREIDPSQIVFHPQLSAFQWAACRLGWSLADVDTLTVHGRHVSQIVPYLAPDARLLVLTQDRTTPAAVAALLTDRGFGDSDLIALASLGGSDEQRFDGKAAGWAHDVPDFHTLAIQCRAGSDARWYPRTGGLPDEAFVHDGQLTKRDVRAATIAKLAPYRNACLWDVGAGCGSVGIEWMRAAPEAAAVAIEPDSSRVSMIKKNASNLGAAKLRVVEGRAPSALSALSTPDAIFIGGGLTTDDLFRTCWDALRPGGRLVANAVTLESEAMLFDLQSRHGGQLTRIAVSSCEPIGPFRGWRSAMPVTQWHVVR